MLRLHCVDIYILCAASLNYSINNMLSFIATQSGKSLALIGYQPIDELTSLNVPKTS